MRERKFIEMFDLSFYKDRKVLVTGHTGFKGTWLCETLVEAGAQVTGYALNPPTTPSLFEMCGLDKRMNSVIGDIRDLEHLQAVFTKVQPEIVLHLVAQPIVRESYKNPVYTYETNVMGTVNVLECIRLTKSVRSFVNVTTDKVYKNREWQWGYRENEELNGYDPYSNSKSCSELVTDSYKNAFFSNGDREVAISTMRAGNVIGGGDFATDRIIPDCIRAAVEGRNIIVRNPYSTRPYQHVLEPIMAYLMVAKEQYMNVKVSGSYNVGPNDEDCWTTGDLVDLFCKMWNEKMGKPITWENIFDGGPHEAVFLKLDCSKIKQTFNWKPRWCMEEAMARIIEWAQVWEKKCNVRECMQRQIIEYNQLNENTTE